MTAAALCIFHFPCFHAPRGNDDGRGSSFACRSGPTWSLGTREESAKCKVQNAKCRTWNIGRRSVAPFCIFHFAFSILHFLPIVALSFNVAPAAAQVQLPLPNAAEPIRISAQAGNHWQTGSFDVWILRGNCVIQQGKAAASGGEAVLWIDHAASAGEGDSPIFVDTKIGTVPGAVEQRQSKVIAYLEGNVNVATDARPAAPRLTDRTWLGRFSTSGTVDVRAATDGRQAGCPSAGLLAGDGGAGGRSGPDGARAGATGAIRRTGRSGADRRAAAGQRGQSHFRRDENWDSPRTSGLPRRAASSAAGYRRRARRGTASADFAP